MPPILSGQPGGGKQFSSQFFCQLCTLADDTRTLPPAAECCYQGGMKSVRPFPSSTFAVLVALALLVVALVIAPRARTQMAAPAPAAVAQIVDQLKKQQEAMVANQAKMDEQVSNLKEEIRLIRIFSRRSGGGGGG